MGRWCQVKNLAKLAINQPEVYKMFESQNFRMDSII
jgi:hypothetical protein